MHLRQIPEGTDGWTRGSIFVLRWKLDGRFPSMIGVFPCVASARNALESFAKRREDRWREWLEKEPRPEECLAEHPALICGDEFVPEKGLYEMLLHYILLGGEVFSGPPLAIQFGNLPNV